jgi:hypothetical protein
VRKPSNNVSLFIAAVAATGALLAGIAAFGGNDGGDKPVTTNQGGGTQVVCKQVTDGCKIENIQVVTPSPGLDDNAVAAQIRRDGPWGKPGARPFMVLRDKISDDELGLYVRTTPTADGKRIGIIQHHDTAWVECKVTTDFDPDPGTGNGPLWYRVHYHEVSGGPLESNPTDPTTGWSYAYYLSPNGHNGELPTCPSTQ